MSEEWANTDLVFRQVHPNHWDGASPNSQAFFPTPKDEDKLSVDDAAQVSAEGSWNHFTKQLGFRSVGTWALSFGEIEAAGLEHIQEHPRLGAFGEGQGFSRAALTRE